MAFPPGTITADLVIKTKVARRRSRMYYISDTAPATAAQVSQIADAVFTQFKTNLIALMPTNCLFERVECRYYGGSGEDLEGNSTDNSVFGTVTTPVAEDAEDHDADVLPDEVVLIIQKRTGFIGRSKRGRLFISGMHEAVQYAGSVADTFKPIAKALAAKVSADTATFTLAGGGTTILHSRHYDRKNNQLLPITKAYALATMGSRRDRRAPLELERL